MKKFLEKLWNFINSKIFGYILIIVAAIIIIGIFGNNKNLKDALDRKDRNIEVMQDSIEMIVTKNGELQASKGAYEGYINELEQYNKRLANEVKKEKGKVVTYNNLIFRLKQDSTELANEIDNLKKRLESNQINDSTWQMDWTLPFIYDSLNYDIYYGRTEVGIKGKLPSEFLQELSLHHNNTWLLNRDSQMKLTWGQKYEGDKLKVFARTAHPAFKAQLLEGTYVDFNEKTHWFNGFSVGPQFGIGYDFINSNTIMTVGVGIQYSIYTW